MINQTSITELIGRFGALENQVKNNSEMLDVLDRKLDLMIRLEEKFQIQQKEIEQLKEVLLELRKQSDNNRDELNEWRFWRKVGSWMLGVIMATLMVVFGWWLNKH